MDWSQFKDSMQFSLKEMGIEVNTQQLEKLYQYMNYLLQENKKYNLTAITSPEKVMRKHILDSLSYYKVVPFIKEEMDKIIDVGSGAGLPGLILKIVEPEKNIFLLDSTLKKINFIRKAAVYLNLIDGLNAIHERAEKLANDQEYREKFDLVTARAVAPLNILAEYTLPFVAGGGYVVFYKGPGYVEELNDGKESVNKLGGKIISENEVDIPGLEAKRYLLLIKKISNTPEDFPRRPGIPKKRPL